jgi:hypothetical protein
MTYEKAKYIFIEINKTSRTTLRDNLIENAVRYSEMRTQWYFADRDKRIEIESQRTSTHNSFIDSCNILSRAMLASKENADWRKHLGDERKIIGDFACYINLFIGLKTA